MRISAGANGLYRFNFRSAAAVQPTKNAVSVGNSATQNKSQDLSTLAILRRLDESLSKIDGRLKSSFRPGKTSTVSLTNYTAARIESSQALGLGVQPATAATLVSDAEINATPTSFSTRGPTFSGSSTSVPTVGGTYNGDNGTQTLSFTIDVEYIGPLGLIKTTNLLVQDDQGATLEQFNLDNYQSDSVLNISNGLTVQLSSGSFDNGGSFDISVYDSVGSVVAAGNSFNGVRNANPNFEEGMVVNAGSFEVNGTTISVAADDSINSIVSKITASDANVIANFNVSTERLEFTQKTPGTSPTIQFDSDTSGFLLATKLVGASPNAGTDAIDDFTSPLSSTDKFSGVSNGLFKLNGTSIAIDVQQDSLSQVLSRINASSAGVEAFYNSTSQRVEIANRNAEQTLSIEDNSTGFFLAVQIAPQVIEPESETTVVTSTSRRFTGVAPATRGDFLNDFSAAIDQLNKLYDDGRLHETASDFTLNARQAIGSVFSSYGSNAKSEQLSPLKIRVNLGVNNGKSFEFSNSDRTKLNSELKRSPADINELLFGSKGNPADGLVKKLRDTIKTLESDWLNASRTYGTLFDILA